MQSQSILEVRSWAGWRARQALAAVPGVRRAAGVPRRRGSLAAAVCAPGEPLAPALHDWGRYKAWDRSKAALAGALAAAALVLSPGPCSADVFAAGGQPLFDAAAYAGRWYEVASLKKVKKLVPLPPYASAAHVSPVCVLTPPGARAPAT